VIAAVAVVTACSTVSAQTPPLGYYVEGGLDFSYFTNDYGLGNNEWMAFILSRPADFSLRLDAGRSERFNDVGIGGGALFTKFFPHGWNAAFGASGGHSRYILPKYRLDASVGKAFLPEGNLQISLGYAHVQFNSPNYFDRISPAVSWWANDHWIFGGYFNYDIGQPGDTATKYGGVGATWFTWEERYIGAQVAGGKINYLQLSEVDYLVAYDEFAVKLYYTEYFSRTLGLNSRAEYLTNELFDMYGISVSIFKVW
jgi:YaiO family outer membrane protein